MWRPEIRQGTDKYAATETLYVLQNLIKQLEIKKKNKNKNKSLKQKIPLFEEIIGKVIKQ